MSGTSSFDLTVVGAGHAGCEASAAASRLGCRVLLVTMSLDRVAAMSCNPAIGGLGKGHIVKEIDALGGMMGLAADWSGIQFRLLNRSKGPAVRGARAQIDMSEYQTFWIDFLRHGQEDITCMEGEVTGLEKRANEFLVTINGDMSLASKTVLITTRTFLRGLMHTGQLSTPGGRLGDRASNELSDNLVRLGLRLGRMKTGTCPRLDGKTINFDSLERQDGDNPPPLFSFMSVEPRLVQRPCFVTCTNSATHEAIRRGLKRSPLYSGVIKGRGPRYCPSIEDKVVRFPDRDKHIVFLEHQGLNTDEIYPNGISTSLPEDIQEEFVHSIKGLESAKIVKFGYAVEYDFVNPVQLNRSLMVRNVPGLFLAGQINGTSGYEEAAGQGLIAGINACRFAQGKDPVSIDRDQAYIGVMIDDLVTAGVTEPYRMFTSRAEHRMSLREDNADTRLTPCGRAWGLVSDERWSRFNEKSKEVETLVSRLRSIKIREGMESVSAIDVLKRPDVTCQELLSNHGEEISFSRDVENTVEILVKFQGYIARERARLEKISSMHGRELPADIDYTTIPGLSHEAVEKLAAVRPKTIGQAASIPGITPAAVARLVIFISRQKVSHETGANY